MPFLDDIRAQFPVFRSQPSLHYLDSAATAQVPKIVIDAMVDFETTGRGNVQRGAHRLADLATQAYQQAKCQVARYLNALESEIIFTGGATSAINLLAQSLGETYQKGDEIIVSQAEHHSNLLPWLRLAEQKQLRLHVIPVDKEGRLDLSVLTKVLTKNTRLLAITHASNVTGVISDVGELVAAAKKQGVQVLLDGAQMVAHGPVDVAALDVDYYVFSGHKCYGPTGIGVLWIRDALLSTLAPFHLGGGVVERIHGDEMAFSVLEGAAGFEAGTPPIVQAIGLGAGLNWLTTLPWDELRRHEQTLCQRLLSGLAEFEGLRVLGPSTTEGRLPLVSFVIEGFHPHDINHCLNESGVALRGGHLCAQPLLQALGVFVVSRASLGIYNTTSDIDALLSGLQVALSTLR